MVFINLIALIVLWSTPAFSGPTGYASSSSNPADNSLIDHAQSLGDDYIHLYLNEMFSDVTLVVHNEKLHAHRLVLATRCKYFSVLLCGAHKEARQVEVPIKEGSATSFKVLLKYIYSGRMDLRNLENKVILELLILSNKIGFTKLQFSLSEYLRKHINVNNVSSLFSVASFYQLKELEAQSLNFIDVYALDVLQSEDALSLSPETLQLILNRDTAYANEVDIFRAACRWIKKYQNELYPGDKTKILSAVRYQLMDDEELSEVRQSDLVRSDTIILDVIKSRIESLPQEFNGRGQLIPNVNFAEQYQKDLYQIDGGTMITFYYPLNINYIEMIYGKVPKWNEEIRPYSYYIEVSTDKRHWLRVVDHSNYHCQSTQRLWINRRFVRYIRIVGTENTSNKKFDFLKVMYNTEKMHSVEIKNGFVAPKYNVILENVDTRVVKIMPEHMHVTLTQPYVLSSLRMLLNDDREPISGYTIKVSTNNKDWDMIVNKSHVLARSWQLLRFESKLVVYILITSERTFLHCVDLEAPAQVLLD